jgi:molybdopterin converting factor subunit 1
VNVSVRLFATLRQQAGWKERSFDLPEGAVVRDILALLNEQQPELNLQTRVVYVAVNEEYAKGDHLLKTGDRVGIFPPVSGGRVQFKSGARPHSGDGSGPLATEEGACDPFPECTSSSCPRREVDPGGRMNEERNQ